MREETRVQRLVSPKQFGFPVRSKTSVHQITLFSPSPSIPPIITMPGDAVDEENVILLCAACCVNCGFYADGDCGGCSGKVRLPIPWRCTVTPLFSHGRFETNPASFGDKHFRPAFAAATWSAAASRPHPASSPSAASVSSRNVTDARSSTRSASAASAFPAPPFPATRRCRWPSPLPV
jgi:hypothetical protein